MRTVSARFGRGLSKTSRRFLVLAAVLVALNAAGLFWIHHSLTHTGAPRLRVLSALPTTDIDGTDRLVLVFDEALAAGATVGAPLERSPFVIDPAAEGHWQWAAGDRLEYLLHKPLLPGRVYRVRPAADLELLTGRALVGPSTFEYRTRKLSALNCHLRSCDGNGVNIELEFNQPVDPEELLRHLVIKESAAPWVPGSVATEVDAPAGLPRPTLLTKEPGEKVMVRVERPVSNGLSIAIKAGLAGRGAELCLGHDVGWLLSVDQRLALQYAEVEGLSLAKDVTVRLWFTRELDRRQAIPAVTLTPAVEGLRTSRSGSCLRLSGPLEPGRRYTATVGETVADADGQTLGRPESVSFEVPNRRPAVRFPADRGLLSPEGNMGIDVEVVNVGGLALSCSRVHANNLVAHLTGRGPSDTSRFLPAKTIKLDLSRNAPAAKTLDLRSILGSTPGVYRLTASATDVNWTSDSAIVTVTDLAITTKRHRDGCLAWVTSLRTGRPVEGAKVAGVTRNNQTVASATTGPDGSAVLRFAGDGPDGPVWVVTAEKDADLSYLLPETRSWVLDDLDQSGREAPETYDVMLYAERGIYRPGETIRLTGIVRDAFGRIAPDLPLALRVLRPDGRTIAELPVWTGAEGQGMFHVEYGTEGDGQIGPYRFTATLPGGGKELGRLETLVEAFVPVRIEVKARSSAERYAAGDEPEVVVDTRYLFGQPASGLAVTVDGAWWPEAFRSDRHKDYTFDLGGSLAHVSIEPASGSLDASGQATLKIKPPADQAKGSGSGLWRGRFFATVTEPGGRSTSANLSCLMDSAGRHVGLRGPARRIVRTGADVEIGWVALDAAGEPAARPAALELGLYRVEWDWTVQQINGQPVWKTAERLIPVLERKIEPSAAAGTFDVRCDQPGRYRLRATDSATGAAAEIEWYAGEADAGEGVAGDGHLTSRPGRVEIVLDKPQYEPGSTARVLVRSPFAGTMLLTIETDRVVDRRVVEMTDKTAELEVPVPATLRGGAFVTATVVRAIDPEKDKWLPHRAMGAARLSTDHSSAALPLVIEAPDKVRPGDKVHVTVRSAEPIDPSRPGVVHLWAVDEGILLTTSFRTPDPMKHFFAPRRLGVTTADVFADLLPDYKRPAGIERIGAGDSIDEEDFSIRHSPVPIRTRASAVVWSAAVPVGPDGTATLDFEAPAITGEMRLMAVAADHDRYGSAARAMTVASPLLVEASWPRFAAPGDRFQAPVKLFNTTGEALAVKPRLLVSGPLQIDGRQAGGDAMALEPVKVDAGGTATIWVDATAVDVGQVTVGVSAEADSPSDGSLTADTLAMFTVRPVAPLHCRTEMLRLAAGRGIKVDPSAEFVKGSGRTTVRISARPLVQLRQAIEQLLGYPYGCVEQTTSKLYGILYAPELISMEAPKDATADAAEDMIGAGIARLWSMQTRSGGLAYWPGGRQPCLWGTAYAAGFLVQARRAGHPIDKRFSAGLLDYLEQELNGVDGQEPDDNTRALICHVLAAFDRTPTGWMNRLSERLDRLDIAGRAHLAAAWCETGRKDRAAGVLPSDTIGLSVARTTGGRITSQPRQLAVLLDVLLDLSPEHPWVPRLVERLEKARRREGWWGTTLESASCLAALARYQTLAKDSPDFKGSVTLPDGSGRQSPRQAIGASSRFEFDHSKPARFQVKGADAGVEISTAGTGDVYVCITREGMGKGGAFQPYDRGLKVRRAWKDRSGKDIDPTKLKVGDLVKVEITCEAGGDLQGAVENVAIVDALPAGLEPENPRLDTSVHDSSVGGGSLARVECRDDRVILFATVAAGKTNFSYYLRAISAGTFELPPIQASCMYDPDFACVHGGGRVEVGR